MEEKIEFSANGFFKINNSLLLSVRKKKLKEAYGFIYQLVFTFQLLSAAASYLIILIQYRVTID